MKIRAAFQAAAAVALAAVLVAVLVLVILGPGRSRPETDAGRAAAPTATHGSVARPVAGPPDTPPPSAPDSGIDPDDPFAGSPAASWASGIAGLATPKPTRVGRFSAAEVAAALNQAKRFVATSHLDPGVLGGGYPHELVALLDPKSPVRRATIENLRHPTKDVDAYAVTRFDPRGTRLHGTVIKLRGTATVTSPSRRELDVTVQLTAVYAVAKVGTIPAEVARVVAREKVVLATFHGMNTTRGKAWLRTWTSDVAGAYCDSPDGFIHPSYDSDAVPEGPSPTGEPIDPYDPRVPVDRGVDCGTVTRT